MIKPLELRSGRGRDGMSSAVSVASLSAFLLPSERIARLESLALLLRSLSWMAWMESDPSEDISFTVT